MTDITRIRNFSIIAHIDHGKSTLADRLIQECGGLTDREMKEQVLDNMDIERERGITIKSQTVRLEYEYNSTLENNNEAPLPTSPRKREEELKNSFPAPSDTLSISPPPAVNPSISPPPAGGIKGGHPEPGTYILNLMDTPGHVDFGYEVSRSLAACEGSLLVVDASQGVEAQTLANVYQAIENDHEIIVVLNKIDLPSAEPERVKAQIEDVIGIDASDAIEVSAKTGQGIAELLQAIVERLPAPIER